MGEPGRARRKVPSAALGILLAAVVGATGLAVGAALARGDAPPPGPAEGSAEAGFARDMQAHHAQAVEMSTMVRDGTDDPEVETLALDIMLTQQQQVGQMYGWLEQWNLPQASLDPPMRWMEDGSAATGSTAHGDGSQTAGGESVMPGMAAEEDLQELDQAEGLAAEVLYLRLMVAHHQGGVAMAESALGLVGDEEVRRLAQAIVTSQTAELTVLDRMLDSRDGVSADR